MLAFQDLSNHNLGGSQGGGCGGDEGRVAFGADPVGVRVHVGVGVAFTAFYFPNSWIDFDHTYRDTSLGGGGGGERAD